MTDRLIAESDRELLASSLSKDEHHKDTTKPDFFYAPGTVTKVYEDEQGPVCFARCTKVLRLDIQYADNDAHRRNLNVMTKGFDSLVRKAQDNGYTEICFQSNSPLLKKFCIQRLGFVEEDAGVLRKYI